MKDLAVVDEVAAEVARARAAHRAMAGPHEGYAVILEELDELWDEVKAHVQDPARMRAEALQVAAMAVRFIEDVCDGTSPTRVGGGCKRGEYPHTPVRVGAASPTGYNCIVCGEEVPSPRDVERGQLLRLLEQHEWNIARVARLMGVTRRTIYLRLERYGIPRQRVPKGVRRIEAPVA